MSIFAENKADKFSSPTQLPSNESQSEKWLEANKNWWEANPMRYDWLETISCPEFSKEYYHEIDSRFFSSSNEFLPIDKIPFDGLIDFDGLREKKVLEIGVGNGSHAQLLATHAADFTGIDLTEFAVNSVSKRMQVFGIENAKIIQMNAEKLEFPDNSFDFVWSWGVIHHSANTRKILKEINRVLKPGGTFSAMVYYRGYWSYYVFGLIAGIFKGHFFKGQSIHQTVQNITDGAIARFYSISEWIEEHHQVDLDVKEIRVLGMKSAILPIPGSQLKTTLLNLIPNSISRFMTNRLRMGSFIVSTAVKRID